MPLLFSICLYTHNRAQLLAQALESVCAQTLPADQFEIIVVDNRSTDDTRPVVEKFASRFKNLRYCYEEHLGSANARNRGWREARGQVIGFIDDDGKAPHEWLNVAARVVRTYSPDLFGGPIYPFYDAPKPDWFRDAYGTLTPSGPSRFLDSPDEYLYGSNLFVRRSLLQAVGGFDERLGMKGRKIGYGEETVLIRMVRQVFPASRLYFETDLMNYHLVRQEKLHFPWQFCRRFAEGRDGYHIFGNGVHGMTWRHAIGILALPVVIAFEASVGAVLRNRQAFPFAQNYYYERVLQRVATFGRLYERLRCTLNTRSTADG